MTSMPPPKRNAALVVTGCLVAMFITAPGQTFVISTFNDSLTEALGLTPTRLAAAYLIGTLLSAASLTPIGRLADRVGPRRISGSRRSVWRSPVSHWRPPAASGR